MEEIANINASYDFNALFESLQGSIPLLVISLLMLVAAGIVAIVATIKLLILTIKNGLSGEKNIKLQALFWLYVGGVVGSFVPFIKLISPLVGLASFIMLCIIAFGKDKNKKAQTIFWLDLTAIFLLIIPIILVTITIIQAAANNIM